MAKGNDTTEIGPPSGFSVAREQDTQTGAGVIAIYYKIAAGGETTIATTLTNSGNWAVAAMEFSGNAAADILDVVASATSGGSLVVTLSSGTTAALAEATELGIAIFGHQGRTSSHTFDNSYTLVVEVESQGGAAGNQASLAVAEQFDVGTGAQETTSSWSTTRRSSGAIGTFKATGVVTVNLFVRKSRLHASRLG